MSTKRMTITFCPVGNGDTALIKSNDDRLLLLDYNNSKTDDDEDKRINVSEELGKELDDAGRNEIDVVMLSHADKDHYCCFSEFFYLNHEKKYQDDDRVRINELWVPAKVLIDSELSEEGAVLRAEARHRLIIDKAGILVFGNSDELDSLLDNYYISPSEVSHLRIGAGETIPGFSVHTGGMELFVHSPHSWITDDTEEERNNPSIILQIRFFIEENLFYQCIMGADAEYPAWCSIYKTSLNNNNLERLDWDIFKISHHCSYTALSDEKGDEITQPKDEVNKIFMRGSQSCYIVSSSNPIPTTVTDHEQPPHKPAAEYYRKVVKDKKGKFFVTMEYPTLDSPQPLTFEITKDGFNKIDPKSLLGAGVVNIVNQRSPRLG